MVGKEKNQAGKVWRELTGGKIFAVSFPGRKFSRRYIFLGGEVDPTRRKYLKGQKNVRG